MDSSWLSGDAKAKPIEDPVQDSDDVRVHEEDLWTQPGLPKHYTEPSLHPMHVGPAEQSFLPSWDQSFPSVLAVGNDVPDKEDGMSLGNKLDGNHVLEQ